MWRFKLHPVKCASLWSHFLLALPKSLLASWSYLWSIDAIDVTNVTLSRLNSINAIDVTRSWLNVECSNVPMFQCSNVTMFQCFNIPIFQSSTVQNLPYHVMFLPRADNFTHALHWTHVTIIMFRYTPNLLIFFKKFYWLLIPMIGIIDHWDIGK